MDKVDNIKELVSLVESGEINALNAYVILKQEEKMISEAIKLVQPLAISEADKYPEKSFKAFGAMIEKKNAASRWDYSNVQEWLLAKERLKQIETIAQVGGMDDSGNEIQRANKVLGNSTISITLEK